MSDTEPIIPARTPDLEWQVAALQRQVFLLLLALVVVTATVVFYLFCQSHFQNTDLTAMRPQAIQIIRTYSQNAQAIQSLEGQLSNYATTHPSFQPILRKYGWTPSTTSTAPAAAQ
jgi:sensor histidine kinase regulating citrate/malate metabolism